MRVISLLPLVIFSTTLAGSHQSTRSQQPVFRASADLVVVDVSVVGRDGTPAKNLRAGDFSVKVDGQPRRVVSMQYVDEESAASARLAAAPGPSRFSANDTGAAGRLVLIAVDEAGIRFGGLRPAVESIEHLLAGFGPTDRIGLATLVGPRMVVGFTGDRRRIVEALKRESGGATVRPGMSPVQLTVTEAFAIVRSDSMTFQDVSQRECAKYVRDQAAFNACTMDVAEEARRVVIDARNQAAAFSDSLRVLLRTLRPIDAPKIMVLFSEGIRSPEAAADFSALGADAAAARTVIYVMRLDDSLPDASGRPAKEFSADDRLAAGSGLGAVAGATRGAVFELAATAQSPFERLAREVSGYYLLGVEAEASARDGRPHRIEVSVIPPGLTVRSRPQYVFTPAMTDEAELLSAALRAPLPATGLPVRVTTFNLADDDRGSVRLMVAAEIDRQQSTGGAAMVALTVSGGQAKPVVNFVRRVDLDRSDSGALSFVVTARVAPGTYTLKLAAVRDGRAGSVEREVVARLTAVDTSQFGDLVLTSRPAAPGRFAPPVDGRVIGDRIRSFMQFGPDPSGPSPASFVLEIAKTADGPAILGAPCTIETVGPGTRVAQADLDAYLLPPGDYVARLATAGGRAPSVRLVTPLTFERGGRTGPERSGAGAGLSGGAAPLAPFAVGDVLGADVVGPFLDEVLRGASAGSRRAIETARAGRFAEALGQVPPQKAADPTGPFIRGLSLLSAGQIDAAAVAFGEASRVAPKLVGSMFYIGACHAAGGRAIQAISAWEASLVSLDRFPVVYRALAEAEARDGRWERAAELLEEALSRWPDDVILKERTVRAMSEIGRHDRVLAYADDVIGRQARNTGVLFLAMQAAFLAVVERPGTDVAALLPRLVRYRDLYRAAAGTQQALVDEWVGYVERTLTGK